MFRRAVLAGFVVWISGCVDAATPSGPRNPPSEADASVPDPSVPDDSTSELRIGDWDYLEADDGTVRVTVTVFNDAPSERSGTVVVSIRLDDEAYDARTDVTVEPDDETDVELAVDVPFEPVDRGGSLYLHLEPTE